MGVRIALSSPQFYVQFLVSSFVVISMLAPVPASLQTAVNTLYITKDEAWSIFKTWLELNKRIKQKEFSDYYQHQYDLDAAIQYFRLAKGQTAILLRLGGDFKNLGQNVALLPSTFLLSTFSNLHIRYAKSSYGERFLPSISDGSIQSAKDDLMRLEEQQHISKESLKELLEDLSHFALQAKRLPPIPKLNS